MFSTGSVGRIQIAISAGVLSLLMAGVPGRAQTFTTADQAFTFTYPQRWQATQPNGVIKITASDGSIYTLKLDSVETALTAGSPVNDAGLKQAAAKIAAPLAAGAAFVRASSISMDHGQGASFRFKSSAGNNVDVWIAIIGKHSAVLAPVRAGQSAQTIGLSVIFQTMAFTDALPKQPARQAPKPAMSDIPSATAGSSSHTVLYSKQIAPILAQRCVACHSSQSASGGLSTASYSAFIAGGTRGTVIKAGNVAGSSLIDYLTGARDQMPKGSSPLSAEEINLFRTWIREGATNDLDPNSGRAATTPSTGINSSTSASQNNRVRRTAANSTFGQPVGSSTKLAKAIEGYAGHLASNDSNFDMRFYANGTVTAAWSFDQPTPARYQGAYVNNSGIYNITLNQVSGAIPGGTKSLKLIMQVIGTDVVGKFSLDTTSPKYKIMGLELSEIDNATKNPNPPATNTNRNKKKPKQRNNKNNRSRNRNTLQ
jgi:mono/diheme cytochrome c family protein